MVASVQTVSFQGISVLDIDVQVHIGSGIVAFMVVGLPDKAVAESRERVRAALSAMGLSLPPSRITVNLAPADVNKEGSHYDLPIALGILAAMGVLPREELTEYVALGELGLDGTLRPVAGILPAAIHANGQGKGLICPASCGSEAAWAGEDLDILAPKNLLQLINHFKGTQVLTRPKLDSAALDDDFIYPDFKDIKGQETARRVLEITAAGGHNVLMIGPPGAGKSMLASRFPGILPDLDPEEALEVSMIQSIAGKLDAGRISRKRPYREPHHSASLPAIVGGGTQAKPGEISLAHRGVLFLDELPEFNRATLESLRQPLEAGKVTVSRVHSHVTYPANFQLVAAMNPCFCGDLIECKKGVTCPDRYQAKISAPLYDRIDLHIDVPAIKPMDLIDTEEGESSAVIKSRVLAAQKRQSARYKGTAIKKNADLEGDLLKQYTAHDEASKALLKKAAEEFNLSARAYFRILRVARTIADLEGVETIAQHHLAEALSYRRKKSIA
ncbi:MAG: YifB family Mg chelatase-like AAA ATPase [Alphaproteobacteria bacterium]